MRNFYISALILGTLSLVGTIAQGAETGASQTAPYPASQRMTAANRDMAKQIEELRKTQASRQEPVAPAHRDYRKEEFIMRVHRLEKLGSF
jgi:hypothetical protein